jgi:hypothetical protein
MKQAEKITHHYERSSLVEHLRNALAASGLGEGRLSSKDLAPLDQFHSRAWWPRSSWRRRSHSTRQLALSISDRVWADHLAIWQRHTAAQCKASTSVNHLSTRQIISRSEQDSRERSATGVRTPYPCRSPQAHLMSLDATRCNEHRRSRGSLRRNIPCAAPWCGRFAIFDVIAGSDSPLHFPVPWSHGPETSLLVTADEMRAELSAQGFLIASWIDCTDAGITWFLEQEHVRAQSAAPPRLWQGAVMGPEFAVAIVNLRRNLSEGRARLIQAVCEKP